MILNVCKTEAEYITTIADHPKEHTILLCRELNANRETTEKRNTCNWVLLCSKIQHSCTSELSACVGCPANTCDSKTDLMLREDAVAWWLLRGLDSIDPNKIDCSECVEKEIQKPIDKEV